MVTFIKNWLQQVIFLSQQDIGIHITCLNLLFSSLFVFWESRGGSFLRRKLLHFIMYTELWHLRATVKKLTIQNFSKKIYKLFFSLPLYYVTVTKSIILLHFATKKTNSETWFSAVINNQSCRNLLVITQQHRTLKENKEQLEKI